MSIGTISLPVSSAPDVLTTLVGWSIYDGVWSVLSSTGLLLVPFIALVLIAWTEARQRQADQDAVLAALRVLETRGLWMLVVVSLAGMPAFEVSVGSLALYRQVCTGDATPARVAETASGGATGTSWDAPITTLGGQSVQVPVWWAVMQALSIGLNNAAIAAIPCSADIRSTMHQLTSNPVSRDGVLMRDLGDFNGDCFRPALGMAHNDLGQGRLTLTSAQKEDLDWFGSDTLLTAYYPTLFAKRGVTGYSPADRQPEQFYTRQAGAPPEVGRPSCVEWWSGSGGPGLRARIVEHINRSDPGLFARAARAIECGNLAEGCGTPLDAENQVIRRLLAGDAQLLSALARSAPGAVRDPVGGITTFGRPYVTVPDYNSDSPGNGVAERVGVLGSAWQKLTFYPMVVMARAAALPVQAIAGAIVIVALPFVLLLSSYSVQTVFTVTFGLFAIRTWTVIWAFARYLDDSLLVALRAMGLMAGLDELLDVRSHAIDFVIGTLYMIAPLMWMGILAWAGWRVGGITGEFVKNANAAAGAAGAAGGNIGRSQAMGVSRGVAKNGMTDAPRTRSAKAF